MERDKCNMKFLTAIFFTMLLIFVTSHTVYAQDNPNTITFDNKSGEQAVVKLIGPAGQIVYVPNEQTRTVNALVGEYYILVRYGSEPASYRYTKGDPFTVIQTATQYSATTITLHKIVGGNYPSHPISAEEFENAVATKQLKRISEDKDISADLREESEKQSVLDSKPKELLPSNTINRTLGVKVRLEQATDPNLLRIIVPDEEGYNINISIEIDANGQFVGWDTQIWSDGAIHEILQPISFAGYKFEPDSESMLSFKVDVNKGYIFDRGSGKVHTPNKRTIILNANNKGVIIGHPKNAESRDK